MSKKDDRIKELEEAGAVVLDRITAATTLIHSVATLLGIEMAGIEQPGAISMATLPAVLAAFTQRISGGLAAYRPLADGEKVEDDDDDDDGLPGQALQTLDKLVDREVDQIPEPVQAIRIVLLAIAREIGIGIHDPDALSDNDLGQTIYAEIHRITHPAADVDSDDRGLAKGDTLAQAVAHGRGREHQLLADLTQARATLARIAEALQIQGKIDEDGTEILERVQRFANLKYTLKGRLAEMRKIANPAHEASRWAIDELRFVLSLIVAPQVLAGWIANKPAAAATAAVLEQAEITPAVPSLTFTALDIQSISIRMQDYHNFPKLIDLLNRLSKSVVASIELVHFMNLIIIPLLDRQANTVPTPP